MREGVGRCVGNINVNEEGNCMWEQLTACKLHVDSYADGYDM